VQVLFRQAADEPLLRLWIEQQLWRHHLEPALVWSIVQATPRTVTAGLRTFRITPSSGASRCPAK
jgi:hypothetical protein